MNLLQMVVVLWDKDTLTKMDKDRFRQDLGNVIETYGEVGERLGMQDKT